MAKDILKMHRSDVVGLKRQGALDHDAGLSYFDNPYHDASDMPLSTLEQFNAWMELCNAWSEGWLERDGGRNQAIKQVLRVRWR